MSARTAKQAPQKCVLMDLPDAHPVAQMNRKHGTCTMLYRMGECTVLVGREPMGFRTSQIQMPTTEWRWHLSIAHPKRYPTWDEMAEAREQLLPRDLVFALLFPGNWDDYVNVHHNCFHLWEVHDREG